MMARLTVLKLDNHVPLHVVTRRLVEQQSLGQLGRVESLEDILVWRETNQGDNLVQQSVEFRFGPRSLSAAHDHVEMFC